MGKRKNFPIHQKAIQFQPEYYQSAIILFQQEGMISFPAFPKGRLERNTKDILFDKDFRCS
ncbi:MAG: hypothetical protein COZ69_10840 [Deltaproteobacteria bacterium CG_4_8_14_3_um_filter_45_9]|nr:MAG: hypothetical protein COS40_12880 [Deltaproteobacteria bacterium CG03_land_8_20_14_0_80_45_14]PIX22539.1 MAG: hypothetical protein COZ69_10840 [Deltaproteobacteria bacterium CG_4_8_14_3_um_filter_45_9]